MIKYLKKTWIFVAPSFGIIFQKTTLKHANLTFLRIRLHFLLSREEGLQSRLYFLLNQLDGFANQLYFLQSREEGL